jgi:hypothetical protein
VGYDLCHQKDFDCKLILKSKYSKTKKILSVSYKSLFCTFFQIISISFIVLDNHFIYEAMIKSKNYFILREKVRSFKSEFGIKYQTKNNSKDNLIMNPEEALNLRMGKISAAAYLDESTIISINGSNRLEQMKNFLEIYRNSSKQSNIIILGDLIYEFLGSQIDTLFVPFKTPDYCYEFAQTLWCQIESLSWFVYPIMVVIFDDYSYELNESEYYSIKRNLLRVEGSDNTLINIPIANRNGNRQNYYLYSYGKEIFVYPLSDPLSG